MQAERSWVRWVQGAAARHPSPPGLRLGIGDDAALVRPRPGHELALTTDLLVEGVHFQRARDRAVHCGHRLAARCLSDLAAMGARPLALFASCALPAGLPALWSRQLMRGLIAAAAEAGAVLAGGDVSAAPAIVLDGVAVGEVPAGRALLRSGARPGDRIFVSGALGLGALGRRLVHAGRSARTVDERAAVRRFQRPRARWELGQALLGVADAALDLSDGLSTDLRRLCAASHAGAELASGRIPHPACRGGLELALHGGDDYELLFTVPPARVARLPRRRELFEIGEISARAGIRLDGRPLADRGWQHFTTSMD